MLYIYFLERKAHCSHSNRFSKHKTFLNIFWSCYTTYLDLENTIATPYPYFILKNCLVVLIYYSFSLIQMFFLLFIVLLVSLQNISTQLSLFKNSSLIKSTLAAALSHKKLAPCLSQKNSHHVSNWLIFFLFFFLKIPNSLPCHGHTISFFLIIFRKPLLESSIGLFKPETHRHFLPLSLS